MTRSITAALFAALAPLAPVAAKQIAEDVKVARRHAQEAIPRTPRPLAEERDGTAQAITVSETASTIYQKNAAQMEGQCANQPHHPPDGEFSFWIMEGESEMVLSGYIVHGVARRLSEFLTQAPQIRTIGLYSGGGRISEALKIETWSIREISTRMSINNACPPALLLLLEV